MGLVDKLQQITFFLQFFFTFSTTFQEQKEQQMCTVYLTDSELFKTFFFLFATIMSMKSGWISYFLDNESSGRILIYWH